jgi:hypothetical protein
MRSSEKTEHTVTVDVTENHEFTSEPSPHHKAWVALGNKEQAANSNDQKTVHCKLFAAAETTIDATDKDHELDECATAIGAPSEDHESDECTTTNRLG